LSPTDGSAVLVRSSFVLTNAVLKLGLWEFEMFLCTQ
jgi:hypothetical protein